MPSENDQNSNGHHQKLTVDLNNYKVVVGKRLDNADEIATCKTGKTDYSSLSKNGDTSVGIAEIQGRRPSQEDRVVHDELAAPFGTGELTIDEEQEILRAAVQSLSEKLQKMPAAQSSGSTLTFVVVTPNGRSYTVNIGDGTAFKVGALNQTQPKCKRLNFRLHNPDKHHIDAAGYPDPYEYKCALWCIEDESKVSADFSKDYSNNQLVTKKILLQDLEKKYPYFHGIAMTRALGDSNTTPFGLRATPDIDTDILQSEDILVLACDGLTESGCLSHQQIAQLVKEHQEDSADEIARVLVQAALQGGGKNQHNSTDNISVIVVKRNALKKEDISNQQRAQLYAICDGHGGSKVSEFLAKNLIATINEKIQEKLKVTEICKALITYIDEKTEATELKKAKETLFNYLNISPESTPTVTVIGDLFKTKSELIYALTAHLTSDEKQLLAKKIPNLVETIKPLLILKDTQDNTVQSVYLPQNLLTCIREALSKPDYHLEIPEGNLLADLLPISDELVCLLQSRLQNLPRTHPIDLKFVLHQYKIIVQLCERIPALKQKLIAAKCLQKFDGLLSKLKETWPLFEKKINADPIQTSDVDPILEFLSYAGMSEKTKNRFSCLLALHDKIFVSKVDKKYLHGLKKGEIIALYNQLYSQCPELNFLKFLEVTNSSIKINMDNLRMADVDCLFSLTQRNPDDAVLILQKCGMPTPIEKFEDLCAKIYEFYKAKEKNAKNSLTPASHKILFTLVNLSSKILEKVATENEFATTIIGTPGDSVNFNLRVLLAVNANFLQRMMSQQKQFSKDLENCAKQKFDDYNLSLIDAYLAVSASYAKDTKNNILVNNIKNNSIPIKVALNLPDVKTSDDGDMKPQSLLLATQVILAALDGKARNFDILDLAELYANKDLKKDRLSIKALKVFRAVIDVNQLNENDIENRDKIIKKIIDKFSAQLSLNAIFALLRVSPLLILQENIRKRIYNDATLLTDFLLNIADVTTLETILVNPAIKKDRTFQALFVKGIKEKLDTPVIPSDLTALKYYQVIANIFSKEDCLQTTLSQHPAFLHYRQGISYLEKISVENNTLIEISNFLATCTVPVDPQLPAKLLEKSKACHAPLKNFIDTAAKRAQGEIFCINLEEIPKNKSNPEEHKADSSSTYSQMRWDSIIKSLKEILEGKNEIKDLIEMANLLESEDEIKDVNKIVSLIDLNRAHLKIGDQLVFNNNEGIDTSSLNDREKFKILKQKLVEGGLVNDQSSSALAVTLGKNINQCAISGIVESVLLYPIPLELKASYNIGTDAQYMANKLEKNSDNSYRITSIARYHIPSSHPVVLVSIGKMIFKLSEMNGKFVYTLESSEFLNHDTTVTQAILKEMLPEIHNALIKNEIRRNDFLRVIQYITAPYLEFKDDTIQLRKKVVSEKATSEELFFLAWQNQEHAEEILKDSTLLNKLNAEQLEALKKKYPEVSFWEPISADWKKNFPDLVCFFKALQNEEGLKAIFNIDQLKLLNYEQWCVLKKVYPTINFYELFIKVGDVVSVFTNPEHQSVLSRDFWFFYAQQGLGQAQAVFSVKNIFSGFGKWHVEELEKLYIGNKSIKHKNELWKNIDDFNAIRTSLTNIDWLAYANASAEQASQVLMAPKLVAKLTLQQLLDLSIKYANENKSNTLWSKVTLEIINDSEKGKSKETSMILDTWCLLWTKQKLMEYADATIFTPPISNTINLIIKKYREKYENRTINQALIPLLMEVLARDAAKSISSDPSSNTDKKIEEQKDILIIKGVSTDQIKLNTALILAKDKPTLSARIMDIAITTPEKKVLRITNQLTIFNLARLNKNTSEKISDTLLAFRQGISIVKSIPLTKKILILHADKLTHEEIFALVKKQCEQNEDFTDYVLQNYGAKLTREEIFELLMPHKSLQEEYFESKNPPKYTFFWRLQQWAVGDPKRHAQQKLLDGVSTNALETMAGKSFVLYRRIVKDPVLAAKFDKLILETWETQYAQKLNSQPQEQNTQKSQITPSGGVFITSNPIGFGNGASSTQSCSPQTKDQVTQYNNPSNDKQGPKVG